MREGSRTEKTSVTTVTQREASAPGRIIGVDRTNETSPAKLTGETGRLEPCSVIPEMLQRFSGGEVRGVHGEASAAGQLGFDSTKGEEMKEPVMAT